MKAINIKKTVQIFAACLVVASATLIYSCKKSDNTPNNPATSDTDVSGANDNMFAENTSNDLVQMGAEASDMTNNTGSLNNFRTSAPQEASSVWACATVTRDTNAKTITLTFNGDTCMDGRVRSGSIVLDYSASPAGATHYRDPGFTFTVTTNNYVVDSNIINVISKTVLNTSVVDTGNHTPGHIVGDETWSITANLQIIRSNNDTITWACNRVKTLLNTADTTVYRGPSKAIVWSKARVGLTGSAHGSRSKNGETFTVNVTDQLVRDFGSCRIDGRVPFILGRLTYTPSNKKYPRYIDYSAPDNGACDLWAGVTINGTTYLVRLP